MVLAAVVATHLNHASDQNPAIDIAAGKREVGAFLSLLHEINEIEYDTELNGPTAEKTRLKAEKTRELEFKKNSMPTPDQLDQINHVCLDDTFLEVLMGNFCNSIISFQSWCKKVNNFKKSLLTTRINVLRDDFLVNSDAISALQEELTR